MKSELHFYDMAPGATAFSTTRQGGYITGLYNASGLNVQRGQSV